MQRWPVGRIPADAALAQRSDELAILLDGMDAMWYSTADARYYRYIQQSLDARIRADDSFTGHPVESSRLGRPLLLLYGVTEDARYYKAASLLRQQLASPSVPAASGSGPPAETQREDSYAAAPFLAQYAATFHEPQDFAEITHQLTLAAQHQSAHPTARSMARYMMALVDALPCYPDDDPGRTRLVLLLQQIAAAAVHAQDVKTGLWPQVLSPRGKEKQQLDTTASSMFTYALAKSVRYGYLSASYARNARQAWNTIQSQRHSPQAPQLKANDDPIAVGSLLLAAAEMTYAPDPLGNPQGTVLLDAWYNSQTRKNATGRTELFHYKWDDYSNSGFSLLAHMFRASGMQTRTLLTAPSVDKLKDARIYIIVSPDIPAKNPNPHYMDRDAAEQIALWVKQGGTLLIMENDPANADIQHMDTLADRFGLHFNNVLAHHVIGDRHDMGRIDTAANTPPFTRPHHLFMKDTCSLSLSGGAVPLLRWQGDTLMAMARFGKGTVVAVTDPWLYNEYTDGRNLPPAYDNYAAGQEFVHWLMEQH